MHLIWIFLIAKSYTTRFPLYRRTEHRGGTRLASKDPHVAGAQVYCAVSLAAFFDSFRDLDDPVGCASSAVSHMALLACKCLRITETRLRELALIVLDTSAQVLKRRWFIAVRVWNTSCVKLTEILTATLSPLGTPYLTGHRHCHYDHLCHCHIFPYSIRERGNTGCRAANIFHVLYVLSRTTTLRCSGPDSEPPVAVCLAFSAGDILPHQ